jgi:hypothetical protein
MSVAWVLAVVAAGLPFALAALLESLRLTRLGDWALGRREAALLLGWLITVPPIVAAIGEVSASREHRSLRHWVTALPLSYPIALSLGGAVLIMVMLTPLVTLKRTLQGRTTLYIPIVVRDGRIRELVADVQKWLAELGHRTEPRTQVGLGSWPMRVIRFAAAHYFGSAVMSDPMQLRAGAVEVTIAPTTVSVVAPRCS